MDNLIFDRTQADVTYASELNRKLNSGEALTTQELADWNAGLKGTYNASDMNRVDAAVREIGQLLATAGYSADYFPPRRFSSPDEPHLQDELQRGAWLYETGEMSDMSGYVCTVDMIRVRPSLCITVRTSVTVKDDSGFCWYDEVGNFIGGTTGGARSVWNGCFQEIVPENAAFCRINIQCENASPEAVGDFITRQYMSGDPIWLPAGAEQVGYIETDGAQYIDTKFKPRGMHTHIWHSCMDLSGTGDYLALIGARNANTAQFWLFYDISVGSYGALDARHGTTSLRHVAESSSTKSNLQPELNKNVYIFSSGRETETLTAPETDFDCPYPIYISAVNNSGVAQYISSSKLEWTTINEDGVAFRDFIPVCNANGRGYYYDLVSGVSFYDQNGGTFSVDLDTRYYAPALHMGDTWEVGDVITQREWKQYIANVQALRDAYYAMPDSPELPEPTAPLTCDGANAIEKLIYDILKLYEGMVYRYRICGTFTAGNDYSRQYIRSV